METEGVPYDCQDLSRGPVAWLVYVHDLRVCQTYHEAIVQHL